MDRIAACAAAGVPARGHRARGRRAGAGGLPHGAERGRRHLRLPHAADGAVAARGPAAERGRGRARRCGTELRFRGAGVDRRRRAHLRISRRSRAAAARGAGLCRRARPRHDLPRVLDADARAGDPGGAGHGGAPPHGRLARAAHHRARGADGAAVDAGRVVGGEPVAGARGARAPAGGIAAGRRPLARERGEPARRSASAGAGTQPAVRPRAPCLRRAEALRGRCRA
ncbi:hypothetical protein D3C71_786380 [compost metagenome]